MLGRSGPYKYGSILINCQPIGYTGALPTPFVVAIVVVPIVAVVWTRAVVVPSIVPAVVLAVVIVLAMVLVVVIVLTMVPAVVVIPAVAPTSKSSDAK